ncbi:hypothetical protein BaRGS_00040327 [Batillaria attramentaria]|uniref:Glycosyltransferase n=1 Tax=Batillaria attramentaria TaxID=370345 RepID=A0ABD0J0I4_9CAEN
MELKTVSWRRRVMLVVMVMAVTCAMQLRALSWRRRVLLVVMATLVAWVSFTRPFAVLFPLLHSQESLTAAAAARSDVRGKEAKAYFTSLPERAEKAETFRTDRRRQNLQNYNSDQQDGPGSRTHHVFGSKLHRQELHDYDADVLRHNMQGYDADTLRHSQGYYDLRHKPQSYDIDSLRHSPQGYDTDPVPYNHFEYDEDTLSQNQQIFGAAPQPLQPHLRNDVNVFRQTREDLSEEPSRQSDVRFAIAIITTRRPAPSVRDGSPGEMDYVLQSATPLHAMIQKDGALADSVLFVCNVDRVPERHSYAVFLKDYLHYAERFGTSSFNVSTPTTKIPDAKKLPDVFKDDSRLEKERHDYMFCMQAALTFDPRYVIMVEDDAVPHADLPDVLEDVLRRITTRRNSTVCMGSTEYSISPCSYSLRSKPRRRFKIAENVTSNFAFVKLFLPEKWRGFYLYDPLRFLDLLSVGVVGAGVYLFLLCISSPRPSAFEPKWRTFVTGVLLSLLIAWLVGRQNLNELRRVSKHFYRVEPSPGCCTPAILYPADIIPPLMAWLAESPYDVDQPLDMRIDGIARMLDLPAFCVEPVLFRHIGMVSTLGHKSKQPEEFLLV